MQSHKLTILITNKAIYFSPEFSVSLADTDIPWRHLSFSDRKDIYWTVEQIGLSDDGVVLRLKVVNYYADQSNDFFDRGQPKRMFAKVQFGPLDWQELEPQLASYTPMALKKHGYKLPDKFSNSNEHREWDYSNQPSHTLANKRHEFSQTLKMTWSDITLGDGRGYFKWHYTDRGYSDLIEISVSNPYLKPEFDLIKDWFTKEIDKRVIVSVKVISDGKKIIGTEAKSDQIATINPEHLGRIRLQRTKTLLKTPSKTNSVKGIFDIKELFNFHDKMQKLGNLFNLSDRELMLDILEIKHVRNQKQLEYLSSSKQNLVKSIKYTLAPKFGFVFYVQGKEKEHFIWELLNSHATYVWSINRTSNSVENSFSRIEAVINTILVSGRTSYKQNYKKGKVDTDIEFIAIPHKLTSMESSEGFPNWKSTLDKSLK